MHNGPKASTLSKSVIKLGGLINGDPCIFGISWEHVLMLIILTPIIIISIVLGLWSEHNLMVYIYI